MDENTILLIDVFPERDNTAKRVFDDVKMSTSILITKKSKISRSIDMGISYKKEINLKNRTKFHLHELYKLNDDLYQIPLVDRISLNLLIKCFSIKNVIKQKSIAPCLTGEVDITFGKQAISSNPNDSLLIKGVQIDRYVIKTKNNQISQGIIEYLDINEFRSLYSGEKLTHAQHQRLVLQGLTGINEKRRLKCSITDDNMYLANSCNYIFHENTRVLKYLLGLLNSRLMNWIFKSKSTSSNVNGYEVDNLPIINFQKNRCVNNLIDIADQILQAKKSSLDTNTSSLEAEIDRMVYEFYGLTEEEIAIVEQG
ncbi:MAG: hypothetical protein KAU06_10250 [Candidatus Marinimicrobia bacterium]|nr:hypothetical protein [Candidatus Neomarinimicrobiota bacterium]